MARIRFVFGNRYITPRQVQIISALVKGLSNKAIGLLLNVETSTIKTQIERLMDRFALDSRIGLILLALKNNFDLNGDFHGKQVGQE